MDEITLSARAEVESALASNALMPPGAPPSIGGGAMADLRGAMARFSGPDTHGLRRDAVVGAIGSLDGVPIDEVAERRTGARLRSLSTQGRGGFEALGELGYVIPTQVLGGALGVAEADLLDLLTEIGQVVRVIGRGEPASEQDDGHAARVLERFADHACDTVAAVSLLYQNYDATAALLASHLYAKASGQERQSALTRTVRVASRDCTIGGVAIEADQLVALDLRSSGFEFGSGPHMCPGRDIAEQIVHGMCMAIDDSGYEPTAAAMTFTPDGRPSTIPMILNQVTAMGQ